MLSPTVSAGIACSLPCLADTYVSDRDLSSSPHACMASALSTKPPLQLCNDGFYYCVLCCFSKSCFPLSKILCLIHLQGTDTRVLKTELSLVVSALLEETREINLWHFSVLKFNKVNAIDIPLKHF